MFSPCSAKGGASDNDLPVKFSFLKKAKKLIDKISELICHLLRPLWPFYKNCTVSSNLVNVVRNYVTVKYIFFLVEVEYNLNLECGLISELVF